MAQKGCQAHDIESDLKGRSEISIINKYRYEALHEVEGERQYSPFEPHFPCDIGSPDIAASPACDVYFGNTLAYEGPERDCADKIPCQWDK